MKSRRAVAIRLCRCLSLTLLTATALVSESCDTPYTRRTKILDEAYQRGNLSREDYLRFAHEAEQWEKK